MCVTWRKLPTRHWLEFACAWICQSEKTIQFRKHLNKTRNALTNTYKSGKTTNWQSGKGPFALKCLNILLLVAPLSQLHFIELAAFWQAGLDLPGPEWTGSPFTAWIHRAKPTWSLPPVSPAQTAWTQSAPSGLYWQRSRWQNRQRCWRVRSSQCCGKREKRNGPGWGFGLEQETGATSKSDL